MLSPTCPVFLVSVLTTADSVMKSVEKKISLLYLLSRYVFLSVQVPLNQFNEGVLPFS